MIKRLLLLLCLTLTAGSAAWADIASGTFKNGGTWKISDAGELYVDAATIPDFKDNYDVDEHRMIHYTGTTAPWSSYKDRIKTIRFSPKVHIIGRWAFAFLPHVVNEPVFESNAITHIIKGQAFYDTHLLSFDFTNVTEIGDQSFFGNYFFGTKSEVGYYLYEHNGPPRCIELPVLEKVGTEAFGSNEERWSISAGHGTRTDYKHVFYLSGNKVPVKTCNSESQHRVDKDMPSFFNGVIVPKSMLSQYAHWHGNEYYEEGTGLWWVYTGVMAGGALPNNGFWCVEDRHPSIYLYVAMHEGSDFQSPANAPWYEYRDQITTLYLYETFFGERGRVGNNSFNGFSNLDAVEGLENFNRIGSSAFESCWKLRYRITFAPHTIVGDKAFKGCSQLGWTDLSPIEVFGTESFSQTNLKDIHLRSASNIGANAFDGSKLKNIYVYRECPPTNPNAFGTFNSKSITLHVPVEVAETYNAAPWTDMSLDKTVQFPVGGSNPSWSLDSDGTLYFRDNVPDYANAGDQPWYPYRDYIRKVEFYYTLTRVGKNAFAFPNEGESRITEVTLPDFMHTIGDNAFRNNGELRSIVGNGVRTIGDYAFAGCVSIQDYKFGDKLQSIGKNAFDGCTNVDVMALSAANPPDVSAATFQGMGSSSGSQGARRRAAGTGQKSVTLDVPEEYMTKYLANIYWRLFAFYTGEHGEVVKSGKYYDGAWVIYSDGTLIASSNTSEGDIDGFYYDTTVKRVEFLGNATELNWTGFGANDLPNVEEIVLSPAMMKLGNEAFKGLSKLKSINLEGVESIGSETFKGCSSLTKADMGNVKEIGDRAFEGCTSLADVTLYGKGGKIGYYTFKDCTSLKSIDMGGINYAASGVFEGCTALESVVFRGQALQIYSNMFKDCSALRSIDVCDDCWSIGSSSLAGTSISRIYSASPKPPTIDETAFGERSLNSITAYVPADYMGAYRKAPVWRNMNFAIDERYGEPQLPTGGAMGENGIWNLDETGALTIDCEGAMPQFDGLGASTWRWNRTFDRWAGFTENVRYTDRLTSIAQDVTDNEAELGTYGSVQTVEIGTNVESIGANAMRYTDLTDVYCFAPEPPAIVTSEENGTFDKAAILAKGTTLHVVDFQGTLEKYKNSYRWNWFPKIVADLPTRKPGTVMVERVHVSSPTGTWLSVRSSELGSTTVQLEANVYPANADNTALVWTSEDESVATVDANGLVTIIGYPDMMEVGITATAADGSNRKGTVNLRIVNPENDWGSVLCEGMDVDRKTITIMKSQAPATITVKLEPANSTANIDFDVVDNSLIQVEAEYDDASGRRTGVFRISAPDPMMMPEIRTGSTQIHFYTHYYDEATLGTEYPEVWVNVNVIEDVRFTEETVQKVPVTYAVTSLEGGTCTVYGEWVDGHDENGTWVDGGYNTAIDQSTTGLVTVPNKARNYYVTGVDGSAFAECSRLEEVEFESGIKFIGNSAFTGCSNLREVLLPETIEAFGYGCFSNLPNLKDVHILATTPPTGGGIYVGNPWPWPAVGDSYAFSGLTGATLHVPAGCRPAYDVYPWNYWFSSIVEDAADGIENIKSLTPALSKGEGAWYSLDGRKLGSKPAKPGIYIQNGKKIVIK